MNRISALFLSLLLFACGSAETAAPVSTPAPTAAPFLVVLDFGHGGFDGGAVGAETGVKESDLNLAIGLQVKDALESRGLTVLVTRADEAALASTKKADMRARGELLQTPGASCTVSIHMNKFSDRSVSGPMTFYQPGARGGPAARAVRNRPRYRSGREKAAPCEPREQLCHARPVRAERAGRMRILEQPRRRAGPSGRDLPENACRSDRRRHSRLSYAARLAVGCCKRRQSCTCCSLYGRIEISRLPFFVRSASMNAFSSAGSFMRIRNERRNIEPMPVVFTPTRSVFFR